MFSPKRSQIGLGLIGHHWLVIFNFPVVWWVGEKILLHLAGWRSLSSGLLGLELSVPLDPGEGPGPVGFVGADWRLRDRICPCVCDTHWVSDNPYIMVSRSLAFAIGSVSDKL